MAEIVPLYATPVYISKNETGEKYDDELEFLEKIDYKFSGHNYMSEDTKIFKNNQMARCKQIINYHLDRYVNEVFSCEQEFYITNSWIAKSSKGEKHHTHYHPNSIISGTFYLQAEDASDIIFYKKSSIREKYDFDYYIKNYNIFNSESWKFEVKTGDIIIFPSSLHHQVSEHLGEKPRIVLGFNTFVKGIFGKKEYASDLCL